MRTCYTAIFNNVDDLKNPFWIPQHWKFVVYTNTDLELPEGNVWEIRKVPIMSFGPVKTARWYKINFHEHIETEESLWIDGTFFINVDLNRWWRRFQEPMTVIKHPFDDCIYTDVKSCLKGGKGDMWELMAQAQAYRGVVPERNGLISSGILMRRKTKEVIDICKTWWSQVEQYSERDQIAFGYAALKHPSAFNTIVWDYTKRDEFIHCPHLTKEWRSAKLRQIMNKYGSKSA